MNIGILSEKTERYIQNTIKMRNLAATDIEGIKSVEEYIHAIEQNNLQIEVLAEENKTIMAEYISPLLQEDSLMSDDLTDVLNEFCEKLLDVYDMVDVDLPVLMRVSDRLLGDARKKQDKDYLINQLDLNVITNYAMMNQFKRNAGEPGHWKKYKINGLKAIGDILQFMEKDAFLSLKEDSSREKVLISTRYFCTLYDNEETNGEDALMIFNRLEEAYRLSEDSFYVENSPGYNWNRHRIKTLEYMGQLTESNNKKSCSESLCQRICSYMEMLEKAFLENPEETKEYLSAYDVKLLKIRAEYFAGKRSKEAYKHMLVELYDDWVLENNPVYAIYCYDLLPLEFITLLERTRITEWEKSQLEKMYQNALNFAMSSESNGSLSFFLEYFIDLLYAFIEIPESTHFESLVLDCFVAIYPPAYVHALMSAKIVRCLCTHLVRLRPDMFIGTLGLTSVAAVERESHSIVEFAYHAAMMHDMGRLAMIETMMVRGRDLMEEEAESLKLHPEIGYKLVTGKKSVERYQNVILGHHKWYDDGGGFPESISTWNVGEKTVTDIVSCVEMLSDLLNLLHGRNVDGEKLKEAIEQIVEASGSRVASFFSWFLKMPEVTEDLLYLMTQGQEQVYTETYIRLHEIAVKKERTFF